MTKEETMERIKLMQDQLKAMQAYVDGKDIELWNPTSKRWELEENPAWSLLWKYRIKPEPTYRPFASAKECIKEMKKHEPFGWVKYKSDVENSCSSITDISCAGGRNFIKLRENWLSIDVVSENCTFLDGSPFGVKVENEEE